MISKLLERMPIRFLEKNVVARTPDTYSKVGSCQYARALRAVFMRCVVFGKLTAVSPVIASGILTLLSYTALRGRLICWLGHKARLRND